MSFAVEMDGISKRFAKVQALQDVHLRVRAQTIHALVGENGAGKTTLMRVLYGAQQPDSGTMRLNGQSVRFRSSAEAIQAGVGMVSQHYSIIPQLTCLQNLVLGAEGGLFIPEKTLAHRASALAERMGFRFDWLSEASHLSPAGAQKLEILKLLWREAKIMILDEPTAMLSPADSDSLFESLKTLTAAGATVILVTHRLPEVLDHADDVTVLRGGRFIISQPVAGLDGPSLAQAIVGHALTPKTSQPKAVGTPLLRMSELTAHGSRGETALKGVNLEVRAGEVLGVAGVDGSGQRELFQTILGVLKPRSGSLEILGKNAKDLSASDRLQLGLRLIPEDRHEEGVIDDWPLLDNAALGLQRIAPLRRGGGIDSQVLRETAQSAATTFDTKHGGLENRMSSLSGGNQQRFVAGRALQLDPKLVLAFQPARGLDIEATRSVYAKLHSLCAQGAAALVVSFDLDELLENCDRVVAMRSGLIHEPPTHEAMDRNAIGRLMVGAQ